MGIRGVALLPSLPSFAPHFLKNSGGGGFGIMVATFPNAMA